jgi:hypothetical protein
MERFFESSLGTALAKRLEAKGALSFHLISDFLILSKSSSQSKLCVLDCLTGARVVVNKFPFTIGSNQASDLRMSEPGCLGVLCLVSARANDQVSVHLSESMMVDGVVSHSLLCGEGESSLSKRNFAKRGGTPAKDPHWFCLGREEEERMFRHGSQGTGIDLDASCVLFDEAKQASI